MNDVEMKKAIEHAKGMEFKNVPLFKWDTEGLYVAGEVNFCDVVEGGQYGPQLSVELSDYEQGLISFYCPGMLADKLRKHKVGVGDIIAVKYFGEAPTKDGNTFKKFELEVLEKVAVTRPKHMSEMDDDEIPY